MSAHSSRPFLNYFCVYKQDWSWDYECKSMHTIYFQKWFYADSCTKFTTSSDLVQQDLQRCKQLKQKRLGVWTWQWKLNSKWDTVSKHEQSLFFKHTSKSSHGTEFIAALRLPSNEPSSLQTQSTHIIWGLGMASWCGWWFGYQWPKLFM